jgi:tetratricopeptide (TPR) repeat protein/tRNA A-37 threonylcarbamoyl transferase component Bud32
MGASVPPAPGDGPLRPSERVDAACDAFEAAWRAGRAPRIEDYLAAAAEPDRPALLGELVALERELRRRRGERPEVDEYLGRFPGHAGVVIAAFGGRTDPGGGPAPRPGGDAGRNLLFGVLALQNNFITRDDLLAAFAAWVADRARPLAQILVDRGALDDARRALLEALVAEHLKQHGGDTEASLAAVSSLGPVREDLGRLGDPDLQASLAATARPGGGAEATAAYTPSSRRAGARFRILRFHREGGLGRVYVARDAELGREVALKEIRPDKVAEADLRTRFVLEAEINGGLEHPGIVPVYSLGTYDDGRPFYAMRFVEGDSLKEAIEAHHKASPRPDPTAVEFRRLLGRFVDVCEAIAFAHSKGVLHRDLKPHNVMLGRYGETLLIDWGLAKATGRRAPVGPADAPEATLVPPSGSGHAPTLGVLGSPPYMSPEQAAGEAESLGAATDVYGLGAILFALLTGEPPVEGKTTEEILDRVRRGAVRPLRSLNPKVPRALEVVCLKAISLCPGDRYPSARALADDVERWLADEPVAARREPFGERVQRWVKRNRTVMTGVAAALVAGVAGLSALAAQQSWANRRLKEANAATTKAKDEAETALARMTKAQAETQEALAKSEAASKRANAMLSFLRKDVLAAARPKDQEGGLGVDVTVRTAVHAAEPKIAEKFNDQPDVEASLRDALGETYLYLSEPQLAVRQHERALELFRARFGPDHTDTLGSRNNLAAAYRAAGRTDEAVKLHEGTLRLCEAKFGPDDPYTLTSRNNLAAAYYAAGRNHDALALDEATLKLSEARLGPGHPLTLASRSNLAVDYRAAGRTDDALALSEATLKLKEATLGPEHPDTLASRNNLAVAYVAAGRAADAVALHEVTLKLFERRLGPEHSGTLTSRNNLAGAYRAAGRTDDAVKLYEGTLRLREAKLGPEHPSTLISRNNLAEAYLAAGRTDEAVKLHEGTLRLFEAKFGPDDPRTLTSRNNLAAAYLTTGRAADAVGLLRTMIPAAPRVFGAGHPSTLTAMNNLASAQEGLGNWAMAEVMRREIVAIRRRSAASDSAPLAGDLAALGSNLLNQSKWLEAEAQLVENLAIMERQRSDDWSRFNAMSLLGGALLGQGRYAEAEPLVVPGYEGMKARAAKIPAPYKRRLASAAERVVRLFEAWGKPEQAAAWKKKLGLADLPADVFARP